MAQPERDAYYTAVGLLSRREYSRVELASKLAAKGFPDRQIAQAMRQLLENDLQSDQRYIHDFVHAHLLKGSGPLKIAYQLKQRGISGQAFHTYLDTQNIDWLEVALTAYQKKYRHKKVYAQGHEEHHAQALAPHERAGRMRFMQSKGFPGDIIAQLFDRK